MIDEQLRPVMAALSELEDDNTVPKNVRAKIVHIKTSLSDNTDLSIRTSKALSDLDDLTNDCNLQSYIRTQIYGIVSLLENV